MGFSKQCTTCSEVKWWYQFGKRKKGAFNLQSLCKACVAQRSLRWTKENPEKVRDAYRKWKEKNSERAKEIRQKHYQKNKFLIKDALKLKIPLPEARRRLYLNRGEDLNLAKTAQREECKIRHKTVDVCNTSPGSANL
jgi:hypothetical protein